MRRSKITGKSSKTIKPLSKGADKGKIDSATGFWQLLAGKVAVQKDGEDPKERGDRLEPVALELVSRHLGLPINLEPGMWLSDDNEDIAITPDAAEMGSKPTWAAEAKCLDSALHLKFVVKDRRARMLEGYSAIDNVPNEYSSCFREQCVQYFVVNENLKLLYFVLYDDRIALDGLDFHFIAIKREDIAQEIEDQRKLQLDALREVDQLIVELGKEFNPWQTNQNSSPMPT
jgi:hypothetical protein